MLLCSGERCITMAIAAGKSAGKPPRMTDKAFKPPTEAAMAMTGNEQLAVTRRCGSRIKFCFILSCWFRRGGTESFLSRWQAAHSFKNHRAIAARCIWGEKIGRAHV